MKNKLSTKKMTAYALMAAVMCILGPLSIQIGPIPISFTNLVIYFAAYILGSKGVLWSYGIYFLLGCFGLPVFSGFTGGLSKLMGPTGGCLIGFFFTAFLSGLVVEKFPKSKVIQIAGIYLSTFITYALAVLWFAYIQNTSLWYSITVCVLPFLIEDLAKVVISAFAAPMIAARAKVNIE